MWCIVYVVYMAGVDGSGDDEALACLNGLERQLGELLDGRVGCQGSDDPSVEGEGKAYAVRKDEIVESVDRMFEYYGFQRNAVSRLERELEGLRGLEEELQFQVEVLGERLEQAKEDHGKPLRPLRTIEESLQTPPEILDLLVKLEEAELRKAVRGVIDSSEHSMRIEELENDPELLLRKGDRMSYWHWLLRQSARAADSEVAVALSPSDEGGEPRQDRDSRVCFSLSPFDENGATLRFKTRYKTMTVAVLFELAKREKDGEAGNDSVVVSTDLYVPGIEGLGEQFFRPGFHPYTFVQESLWPLLEPRHQARTAPPTKGAEESTVQPAERAKVGAPTEENGDTVQVGEEVEAIARPENADDQVVEQVLL